MCEKKECSHDAARELRARAETQRQEVRDKLHWLDWLEARASEAGPSHPAFWDALALVYRLRPELVAELIIVRYATGGDLVRFITGGAEVREQAIDRTLLRGGLLDRREASLSSFNCREPGKSPNFGLRGGIVLIFGSMDKVAEGEGGE